MITISIQDTTFDLGYPPVTVTASQLVVAPNYNGMLDSSATFSYWLQDSSGKDLIGHKYSISGAQYEGWGTGDQTAYIQSCILSGLGLTAL